ncbi:hypothetical protein [Cupriavidus sp. IDO]|uniref:hypothetical protein n=1 Tax=Cupriavidus sp. IDO TaxID=1539142 RepID=UPI000578EEA6|nr:hypothetical protein [Cupriavidus sp. IDO]KWR90380.1 hypothetical protein RM96_10180 [Cupriavidus sp. IDO]
MSKTSSKTKTASVNAGVTNVLCTSTVAREACKAQNTTMLKGLGIAGSTTANMPWPPHVPGRPITGGETW